MKRSLEIEVPANTSIVVVGDIHEHDYQFDKLLDQIQPSANKWLVSVGDIYDKGFGREKAEKITDQFIKLNKQEIGFVIRGNHELKNIKKAKNTDQMTEQLNWFKDQPLALCFVFENSTRLTVVHGGVTPHHSWEDLGTDIETCYVRNIDDTGKMIQLKWIEEDGIKKLRPTKPGGVSWHSIYNGRFGYIASGHEPLKDGKVKFYNYSCNLDTSCFSTGILSCQEFSKDGLGSLYTANGPCKRWKEE